MNDYLSKFRISKTNPFRYLRRELLSKGIKEGMIYALLGRHDVNDLIGLIEKVGKVKGYDFPGLFVRLADKELPRKKPKPRQQRLPKIVRRVKKP